MCAVFLLPLVAPDNTAYKWWSCPSGLAKLLCKLCQNILPYVMGADLAFFPKPVMRTHWMTGAAPH